MHEPAFVRIERPELLIDARSACTFSASSFAICRSSESLPLRYPSASTKTRRSSSKARPYAHVDDVLQRLERLAAVADEQLGLVALEVEARTVGRLLDRRRGR